MCLQNKQTTGGMFILQDEIPIGLRNGNFNKHISDNQEVSGVECTKRTTLGDINGTLA